jgi:hypothetical protein
MRAAFCNLYLHITKCLFIFLCHLFANLCKFVQIYFRSAFYCQNSELNFGIKKQTYKYELVDNKTQ